MINPIEVEKFIILAKKQKSDCEALIEEAMNATSQTGEALRYANLGVSHSTEAISLYENGEIEAGHIAYNKGSEAQSAAKNALKS